jgi:hypothetical protein
MILMQIKVDDSKIQMKVDIFSLTPCTSNSMSPVYFSGKKNCRDKILCKASVYLLSSKSRI